MKIINWKALLFAPALVPFLFSLTTLSFNNKSPLLALLFIFILACFVSYGITVTLFLPCLYLLSKITFLNRLRLSLLGFILGAIASMPVVWIDYCASGVDSGPPSEVFSVYLMRQLSDPFWWLLFPVAGLVTATVYWLLRGSFST